MKTIPNTKMIIELEQKWHHLCKKKKDLYTKYIKGLKWVLHSKECLCHLQNSFNVTTKKPRLLDRQTQAHQYIKKWLNQKIKFNQLKIWKKMK